MKIVLTDEQREKSALATRARHAAIARLKNTYPNDYAAFEREERVSRGLPAEKVKSTWKTVNEMRDRIKELEELLGQR